MPYVTALVAAVAISLSATVASACNLPPNAASLMADAGSQMNSVRSANGRATLRRDARLDRAAQRHACWMSTNGTFSHQGGGNSSPSDRIAATGYPARMTSENIAQGRLGLLVPGVGEQINNEVVSAINEARVKISFG